jgi:hypothetical protein
MSFLTLHKNPEQDERHADCESRHYRKKVKRRFVQGALKRAEH